MSTVINSAPILIVDDLSIILNDPNTHDGNLVFLTSATGDGRGLYCLNSSGVFERLIPLSEAGGWTYVKLDTDAATTGTTNVNTALAFTPQPNKHYEIEDKFFLESAATTTGGSKGYA